MKYLFSLLFSIGFFACTKDKSNNDCVAVTITQQGTACNQWAIKVNGNIYQSNNIPTQFQQEGLAVCATYDLYDDMRACVCCGGTWANIKTMKIFVR